MTEPLTFYYPRGCGGSWLANLIWHLERESTELPKADVVFDREPKSSQIKALHAFEILNPLAPTELLYRHKKYSKFILFSTGCLFNMYINDAYKVRYHILGLSKKNTQDQLFTLSDSMRFIWTNQDWHKSYCGKNDLEYKLIFQDPDKFIDILFDILHKNNVKFVPDRDYAKKSIQHYRSTCVNPLTVYGNMNNLVWLACCHAVSMLKEIPLPITITPDTGLEEIKEIMIEFSDLTQELVSKSMFTWA
jgi:hypothetical protein